MGYFEDSYEEEWLDWFRLTPPQRFEKSLELFNLYLTLGGSLDPEPDTQSPFFDPEAPIESPTNGGAGVRILRRSGV